MHFWVDILIVLYRFGFGTARLGEWRLNHIHSINGAEVINASCSAEIDYSRATGLNLTHSVYTYRIVLNVSTRFYFSVGLYVRSQEPRIYVLLSLSRSYGTPKVIVRLHTKKTLLLGVMS